MIHAQYLDDRNFVARFEREARIVAKLDHPNIVPVYDAAEYNGLPYIVMKYIEGTTLKNVLLEGALTIGDILDVMSRLVAALDYAHGQGVLHRDIKPSNIMLDVAGDALSDRLRAGAAGERRRDHLERRHADRHALLYVAGTGARR